MVTWSRRYRSTEKGYSRLGAKRDTQMILDEDVFSRGVPSEIRDSRDVADLVFDSGTPETAEPTNRLASLHDVVWGEPIVIEPETVDDPMGEALAAARESIRSRVAGLSRELEPPRRKRGAKLSERFVDEPGVLTRAWRRIVGLFR